MYKKWLKQSARAGPGGKSARRCLPGGERAATPEHIASLLPWLKANLRPFVEIKTAAQEFRRFKCTAH